MDLLKYIVVFMLLTSCYTTRKHTEHLAIKHKARLEKVSRDSIATTLVNRSINDRFTLSLKTNDKKVDSIIRKKLAGFVGEKTSGKNSYKASFDAKKLALDIAAKIGQTREKTTTVKTKDSSRTNTEHAVIKTAKTVIRRIPWWFYLLFGVWFFPTISEKLSFYTQAIQKFLVYIKNKKNDNNHPHNVE